MSGAVPVVAHGQIEINDHLQHFKIPLATRQVLVGAVAVRQAEGATAASQIRASYVAIRAAEDRPVACYAHRTMLSLALDPEVAETVCQAHRFCQPNPDDHNQTTRHVRIRHADIKMYAPIVGELVLVALQRSWDRPELAEQAEDDSPPTLRERVTTTAARAASGASAGASSDAHARGTVSPAPAGGRGSRSSTAASGATGARVRTPGPVAPAPAPRPAAPVCPIHFHPLINGECDYCN